MSAALDMGSMIEEEHGVTSMLEGHETTCWGCGLRVLVPSFTRIFKCGWCGAITNQNPRKHESERFQWRYFRDRCFVSILILFMLFVICGGVWAVYPVVFSISFLCGATHSVITMILSVSTIACFSLAAFRCAGTPPSIIWGSYPVVGKGGLEHYTFCSYCSKPKSPRTHHCRSCQMCILDMDHHCPFIGNCVGAANHRCFVMFLISAIISTIYACVMSAYAGLHIWPPFASISLGNVTDSSIESGFKVAKDVIVAFLNSAVLLSARDLVLVYLFVASFSVGIGLSVLLWQQLRFIYMGKTYLSHLSSQEENRIEERDCQNLVEFFGFHRSSTLRFRSIFSRNKKSHKK